MLKNKKGGSLLIILVMFLALSTVSVIYFLGIRNPSEVEESPEQISLFPTSFPSTPSKSAIAFNNPPTSPYNDLVISPEGKYSFELNMNEEGFSECSYIIKDISSGEEIKLESIGNKIPCQPGPGYTSAFLSFGSDGKLAIGQEPGKIAIVDITTDTFILHSYDPSLTFSAVNSDFSRWLFKISEPNSNSLSFVLKDKNNESLKQISFLEDDQTDYALFRVMNDTINDGFVFVSRKYQALSAPSEEYDSEVSYKFDFLFASDLRQKTLLTTDYTGVVGRGCGGDSLASIKGEVIIKPGCIVVNDKYKAIDKTIHIKL